MAKVLATLRGHSSQNWVRLNQELGTPLGSGSSSAVFPDMLIAGNWNRSRGAGAQTGTLSDKGCQLAPGNYD